MRVRVAGNDPANGGKGYPAAPVDTAGHGGNVTLMWVLLLQLGMLVNHSKRAHALAPAARTRQPADRYPRLQRGSTRPTPSTRTTSQRTHAWNRHTHAHTTSSDIEDCNLDCLDSNAFNFTGCGDVTEIYLGRNQFVVSGLSPVPLPGSVQFRSRVLRGARRLHRGVCALYLDGMARRTPLVVSTVCCCCAPLGWSSAGTPCDVLITPPCRAIHTADAPGGVVVDHTGPPSLQGPVVSETRDISGALLHRAAPT